MSAPNRRSESEVRSGLPRTNERTYERTERSGHLTGDTSSSVTRTHTYEFRFCEDCDTQQPVIDEFDDQIGYEEQARPVRVVALECGHDIVTELRR